MGKSARSFSTSSGAGSSCRWSTVDEAVIRPPLGSGDARRTGAGKVTLVPGLLEPLGELRPALLDDAPADEDVHEVRRHVPQDPGVVGDEQHPGLAGRADAVDALAHHAQRVDVQAGVGLVEYG